MLPQGGVTISKAFHSMESTMTIKFNCLFAVAAAAATFLALVEPADAQSRRGGPSFSGNFGSRSVGRSFTQRSFNRTPTRSFNRSVNINRSRTFNRTVIRPRTFNQNTVVNRNRLLNRNLNVNRNANLNRLRVQRRLPNNTQLGNNRLNLPGLKRGNLPGINRGNLAGFNNRGRNLVNNLIRNPALRNVPFRTTVRSTNIKLGRIAPPINIVPRLAVKAAPVKFAANRFKPFLQRHWRRAFFWIAIPTIGYITIPDHAYDRFVTYVERDEPDYDGAIKYLSRVAVEEEGSKVVRVAAPPPPAAIKQTVAVAPDVAFDTRLAAFVNRQWSTEFVWIEVPRIGRITCPKAIYEQVQPLLANTPPKFEDAVSLLEEAAAADTVVDEGALSDASVESVQ